MGLVFEMLNSGGYGEAVYHSSLWQSDHEFESR